MMKSLKIIRTLMFGLVITLIISVPFLLMMSFRPEWINSFVATMHQHHWTFRLIRWSFIMLFIVIWPRLMSWLGKRRHATPETIATWQQERWRVGIWLVLFECLVGENMMSVVLHRG